MSKRVEKPKDKCQGCNNVKGCITCVDNSEWAHIDESKSDIKAYHDRWGKSNGYIEEPVSGNINFEQELYKAFGQVKDFTLSMQIAKWFFKAGANWQKENLWKPADGNNLPEIDREVIALLDNGKVVFTHRPPEFWDGKDIGTGKVIRYYPKTYDKGGWNISDVKFWLDVELPKEIEL